MLKLEAKFISQELMPYLKAKMKGTYGWEAKFVRKGKYYLSDKSLKKEIQNLKICGRHFCYKFPDMALQGTPMDGCSIHEAQGFIFFKFDGDPKHTFYRLTVDKVSDIIEAGRTYIDKELCQKYGTFIGKTKP